MSIKKVIGSITYFPVVVIYFLVSVITAPFVFSLSEKVGNRIFYNNTFSYWLFDKIEKYYR